MKLGMPTLSLLLLVPSLASALSIDEVRERFNKSLNSLPARTELSVRAEILGGKRQVLFEKEAEKLLIPASSNKLLISVAALDTMGPGYTFKTEVRRDGPVQGPTLAGNLILRGNGDPFLVSERLWLLAREVARSGIKRVNGGIRVDNGFFSADSRDLLQWMKTGEKYATIVSATSLNFNSIEVHVRALGDRIVAETGPVPHEYAILKVQAHVTGGSGAQLTLEPEGMQGDREVFVLRGTIGRNAPPQVTYSSVSNPASYIAFAFAAMLKSEGITLAKNFAGVGKNIRSEGLVATLDGLPLLDLVRSLNTYSNNFMTEQIFQSWGAFQSGEPASTEKSREALKKYLERRGICKDIAIDNGSGLSWNARVNAKCFVDLLQNSYRDFRVFADLLGSMPIGGSTGTLKHRFKGRSAEFDPLKVRAKTGTLWSEKPVTSLVGFTQTKSGETAVYAIILNNAKNNPELLQSMRDWEDQCIDLLQQLQ